MVNVTSLVLAASEISAPTGLWATILNWIEKSVVNYGWVILLFTLLIKVCLSPLDLVVKFSTKKTTLVQEKLAPQMARLQKKYANDPTALRNQQNALYKREGFNGVLSCLIMIVNLAVTLTVFLTLFSSLREISAYKAINQYISLENAYKAEYESKIDLVKADFKLKFNENAQKYGGVLYELTINEDKSESWTVRYENVTYENETLKSIFEDSKTLTDPEGGTETVLGLLDSYYSIGGNVTDQTQLKLLELYFKNADGSERVGVIDIMNESAKVATDPAAAAASEVWKDVKDSWLWVDNIWVADSYKSPLPTYADLKNLASSSKVKQYKTYVASIDPNLYATVTSAVHAQNSRWNGYFILAVMAGGLSFLSQWVTEAMGKSRNKRVNKFVEEANPQSGMMKFMKFLLPALMVIFVVSSSAGFGIYIVASSLFSIGISALTSLIVNACYKKKEEAIYVELEKEAIKSLKKKRG